MFLRGISLENLDYRPENAKCQCDGRRVKAIDLHTADPTSVPGISYGPTSTAKSKPCAVPGYGPKRRKENTKLDLNFKSRRNLIRVFMFFVLSSLVQLGFFLRELAEN